MNFAAPADHRVIIKESLKNRQIPWSCQKAEKAVQHEGENDTNCSLFTWNGVQRSEKWIERTGDQEEEFRPFRSLHC